MAGAGGNPDAITGYGAVSAVGLCAESTAAAVRANVTRFVEHPFHWPLLDPPYAQEPQPLICAPVAFVDPLERQADRLLNLALAPLQDLISRAQLERRDVEGVGLFLAMPSGAPGATTAAFDAAFAVEFARRAALPEFVASTLVRTGSVGFFHALELARKALESGACQAALVGGVDSHLSEGAIARLDERRRLKTVRTLDGFVPGEAAALVWIERASRATQRLREPLGLVSRAMFAREPRPFVGERQSSGEGLSSALRAVLADLGAAPAFLIADLNGESYRAFEWGVVRTRLAPELTSLRALWHPADCFGDVGVAAAALHSVLACEAFRKRYSPAATAILFAGDDAGERAAVSLSSPPTSSA